MSHPKQPPAGSTPRVHHPVPTGQGGAGQGTQGQGAQPSNEINAEDYKNRAITDYLKSALPSGIVYDNGQPEAAPTGTPPPPQPVQTPEQAARAVSDAVYAGLTTDTDTCWRSIGKTSDMAFLMDGINPRAVKVKFPFNSPQVCDGAVSMIKAGQTDAKAKCMEVDIEDLGRRVALALRISRAREEIDRVYSVLEANETVVLRGIAEVVQAGLKLGASVIAGDGHLSWVLGPALAIRGEPADQALATRAQNARDEQAIRADEQTKLKAAAAQETSATTSTTVITQPGPGGKK